MTIQQMMFGGTNPIEYIGWIANFGASSTNYIIPTGNGFDSSMNMYISALDNYATQGVYVAKFNATGSIQWQRKITSSGASSNTIGKCATDASGNTYVCGSFTNTDEVGFVAKYDSSGAIQWQRSLTLGAQVRLQACALDSAGSNVVAIGFAAGSLGYLVSYTSSGTLNWQRQITTHTFVQMCIDPSGNIYTVGSNATGAIIVKYDSAGTLQWQRLVYSGASGTNSTAVAANASNVWLVTNEAVVKLDTSGNVVTSLSFGGGRAVSIDSTNVYLAKSGPASNNCTVFAFSQSANTAVWTNTYATSGGFNPQEIKVDENGYLYYCPGGSFQFPTFYGILSKVPANGTKNATGTVAVPPNIDYAVSTAPTGFVGVTSTSTGGVDSAGTATSATSTFTDAAGSLTSSVATLTA
jgi:hypothetical protein